MGRHFTEIDSKNFKTISTESIAFFAFAEGDAKGEMGGVVFVTMEDGKANFFHTNYEEQIEVTELEAMFPPFKTFSHRDREKDSINIPGWAYVDLGEGNHLLLREELYPTFVQEVRFLKLEDNPRGIYTKWFEMAERVIYYTEEDASSYVEAIFPAPSCNHTLKDPENQDFIGYTTGILSYGIPFEAEVWCTEGVTSMAVVMARLDRFKNENFVENVSDIEDEVVVEFSKDENDLAKRTWATVLTDGMTNAKEEPNETEKTNYLVLLNDCGILDYKTKNIYGYVQALVDLEGNECIALIANLHDEVMTWAETGLGFRPLPGTKVKNKTHLKLL